MDRNRIAQVVALSAALLWLAVAPTTAAQKGAEPAPGPLGMLQVTVRVDGLSCPFCAYGLEKKLKKLDHVAKLSIRVDEERAVLIPEPATSLDLEQLERAVREGGFTPRGIVLEARGRLTRLGGAPALQLPHDTVLLLQDPGASGALSQLAQGSVVRVQGEAVRGSGDGRPYTLLIGTLESA